ncbi:GyrI-like domain-containing protein [Telluribacter sp.]|jgi:predicted transcriptional regulator YdeE|uniref:GyrI-like domain-containing protein n=1 Tax=Telluribacter sp. TaxID=1978767 RepID=UPI002E14578D|nr:GyrI-like domain-containing protein [Telluribacter sp.]
MTTQLIPLDPIYIVGISVRTINQNGQSGADISSLWLRFFSEDIASKVPSRTSDDLYCVYTDYESDHTGAYTTLLGYRVESEKVVPEGLILITIPAGIYNRYTSEGKLPYCVLATWEYIWRTTTERSYMADFDMYGPEAQDQNNAQVQTFVSVAK